MEVDFKTKLKVVKFITSALFARKQPFMIINGNEQGVFYYTNVEVSRVVLYRPTIEDVVSKVKIVSEDVLKMLYEAYPAFKNIVAQIDLRKFSTAVNKCVKEEPDRFPELVVNKDTNELTMCTSKGTVSFLVGNLVSEHDISYYEEIVDKFSKFGDRLVRRSFKGVQVDGDDKVSLEITDIECDKDKAEFGFPIKDGVNLVSMKEYINKRKLDASYSVGMLVNSMARTAKVMIDYADDWLNASTMMPGSLWFLSKV